jgi:hypothetical protein
VRYEGDNGYAAMVAEVEVDQDTGKVAVKRIVVATDAGADFESRRAAQPDGRRRAAGDEPGAGEEVTWDDQKVTSFDWRTYHTSASGFRYSRRSRRADQPAG